MALEADAKLNAIDGVLGKPASTERLVDLLARLTVARPTLTEAKLERPEDFWRWLAPLFTWREGPPWSEILGLAPPCLFHERVIEARADLESLWAPPEEPPRDAERDVEPRSSELERLRAERVDAWVHIAQLGDGHQDLFWDQTFSPGVRVLLTDNREPDVLVDEWRSAAAFLRGWFLPQALRVFRPGVEAALRPSRPSALKDAAFLGGVGLFMLAAVGLLGFLLHACGVL